MKDRAPASDQDRANSRHGASSLGLGKRCHRNSPATRCRTRAKVRCPAWSVDRGVADRVTVLAALALVLEAAGLDWWTYQQAVLAAEFDGVHSVERAREVGSIEQIVDPECPIPAEATAVHGITDAMATGMPTVA